MRLHSGMTSSVELLYGRQIFLAVLTTFLQTFFCTLDKFAERGHNSILC